MTFADQGRSVDLRIEEQGQQARTLHFRGDAEGAVLTNDEGQLLSESRVNAQGEVEVSDGLGHVERHTQEEGASLVQAILDRAQTTEGADPEAGALARR